MTSSIRCDGPNCTFERDDDTVPTMADGEWIEVDHGISPRLHFHRWSCLSLFLKRQEEKVEREGGP